MQTIPRRGRQTLCHQNQSGVIRNETLNKVQNAKNFNQIRHLLNQFGVRSLPSIVDSSAQTSSSTELFGQVYCAPATTSLYSTPSPPSPPPTSLLLLEPLNRQYLRKRTSLSTTDKEAAVATDNRTKNHSSDGNDVNTNCISTSNDIDWYIQLASKCYTDGFLSHVRHLDECTRPRSEIIAARKLQRQHNRTSTVRINRSSNRSEIAYVNDSMNISPATANRVNDLISSFYTLNLTTADDNSLPQIILTDFSNNSLQPTTTPLFLSTTDNLSSVVSFPVNVPNVDDDNATDRFVFDTATTSSSTHHQYVADEFKLPETRSQLLYTSHFSASPNYYQFDSNGSRSFNPN